jgi:DNA-binding beta-propeller fold protein YncE
VYGKNPNKGHEVYIFDLTARTVAGVIDIAPYRAPHAVRIDRQGTPYVASDEDRALLASPDGRQVVAMDLAAPRMHVIDPRTDTVVDRIVLEDNTGGAYKASSSPDGKRILTMSLGGKVNQLDPANLRGEHTVLTAGRAPMGFAFSADGKTALAANHGDGSVSVIDLMRNRIAGQFHGGTGIETLT